MLLCRPSKPIFSAPAAGRNIPAFGRESMPFGRDWLILASMTVRSAEVLSKISDEEKLMSLKDPTTNIRMEQVNPKKQGSKSHMRYESYKTANTVEKFKELIDVVSRKHFSQPDFTVFNGRGLPLWALE